MWDYDKVALTSCISRLTLFSDNPVIRNLKHFKYLINCDLKMKRNNTTVIDIITIEETKINYVQPFVEGNA